MKLKERKRMPAFIPTSSMSDIAFLLIIFFMLTSTFLRDMGLEVDDLERAAAARANTVAVIAASIRRCAQQQKAQRVGRRVAATMALDAAVFGLVVGWPAIASMLKAESPSVSHAIPALENAINLNFLIGA